MAPPKPIPQNNKIFGVRLRPKSKKFWVKYFVITKVSKPAIMGFNTFKLMKKFSERCRYFFKNIACPNVFNNMDKLVPKANTLNPYWPVKMTQKMILKLTVTTERIIGTLGLSIEKNVGAKIL